MGLVASVCQPSTLRMLIWAEASKAQNNMAAVSADGSTVCVLIRRSRRHGVARAARPQSDRDLAARRHRRALLHCTAKQRTQRTAYTARVGAGEIAAGNQCVGGQRAALVGSQRLALPLGSGVFNRARGTAISTLPNVPSNERDR